MLPPVSHSAGERYLEARRIIAALLPKPAPRRLVATVTDVHCLPTKLVKVTADQNRIDEVCSQWREGDPVPSIPGIQFAIK